MPKSPAPPKPPILVCKSQTGSKYPTTYASPERQQEARMRELQARSAELRAAAKPDKPR